MISMLSDFIEVGSSKLASIIILIFPFFEQRLSENPELIMLVIGFAGQALFASRFILQWLTSESVGKSVIPIGFWWKSDKQAGEANGREDRKGQESGRKNPHVDPLPTQLCT